MRNPGPGRPEKEWTDMSDRTKRRKVAQLAKENPTEALAQATAKSAKGNPEESDIGFVIKKTSENATQVRRSIENAKDEPIMMTGAEALALKINCDLSDNQYQMIRNSALKQNANIYPTLQTLRSVKSECYPDNVHITETSAKTSLQSLVDKTLSRVLLMCETELKEVDTCEKSGTMFMKAGFDGASGQSIYNKKFEYTDLQSVVVNEESLFQSGLTPLMLKIGETVVWKNPKPNSSHFNRPLHLQYKKETKELTVAEEQSLRCEIDSLSGYQLEQDMQENDHLSVNIKYKIDITMLDGKAVNALTDTTSTQSCNICSAKPSEMNKLELVRGKKCDEKAISLGLSTMHMWIRNFEYVLHMGYKMEIKKFQARTPDDKLSVLRRKNEIKQSFRDELHLVVDTPKQGGSGNTNSGPTAKRAFQNAEQFSEITGVDVRVIKRLRNILKAVCSGYYLNIEIFKRYCFETSELLVELYDWYTIPPSVHKLLEHGYMIGNYLELPIGIYSEEEQEAGNKELRNARLSHTCKISRQNAMENQYHHMLLRTDPVISSISFINHKSLDGKPLEDEVLMLLTEKA